MTALRWIGLIATVLSFLVVQLASPVEAREFNSLVLPQPGMRSISNLKVEACQRWPASAGYRRLLVRASVLRPVAQDREITVSLVMTHWARRNSEHRVNKTIRVPASGAPVTVEILVPDELPWNAVGMEVSENGRQLNDVSSSAVQWVSVNYVGVRGAEEDPTILLIDRDAPSAFGTGIPAWAMAANGSSVGRIPDIRMVKPFLGVHSASRSTLDTLSLTTNRPLTDRELLDATVGLVSVDIWQPAELSDNWLAYTSIDFVMIEWSELEALIAQHPAVWQAMRQAVGAGMNLIVYDLAGDDQRLVELEQQLMQGSSAATPSAESADALARWRPPQAENYNLPFVSGAQYGSGLDDVLTSNSLNGANTGVYRPVQGGTRVYGGAVENVPIGKAAVDPLAADPVPENSQGESADGGNTKGSGQELTDAPWRLAPTMSARVPFQLRTWGFGNIVAMDSADILLGAPDRRWDWLLREIRGNHYRWVNRFGFTQRTGTPEFWDFLVPGVGATPIKSYLGMITIFGIVIGPLNYWLLRRLGRLSMLLLTVPLGAGLVTLGLFCYAVVVDGLDTKAYLRSYTMLDSTKGEAISWSRQCYHAGLAPSQGLVFSDRTAVAAIYATDPEFRSPYSWQVDWEGDQQRLSRGFISSRTMRQFSVVHQGPNDARLEVASDERRVKNMLGVPVKYLLLRHADGKFSWAENLGDGAEIELEPGNLALVSNQLTSYFSERYPTSPVDANMIRNSMYRWNSYGAYYSSEMQSDGIAIEDSLLEAKIAQLNGTWRDLEPRSYLAITEERPSMVPIGVTKANEVQGFHIIQGSW